MTWIRSSAFILLSWTFILDVTAQQDRSGANDVWSKPGSVQRDLKTCVEYRARLHGAWLIVEAKNAKGWHTYAMDNSLRAKRALKGKKPLGVEQGTRIALSGGLKQHGDWFQSRPKDLSKPELQWYTWGFEGKAYFVTQVRRVSNQKATLLITGQACDEGTCQNVKLTINLSSTQIRQQASKRVTFKPESARYVKVLKVSPISRPGNPPRN